jgi:putative redox protein
MENLSGWVSVHIGPKGFKTEATASGHTLIIDEPKNVGGTELGPTPYEYLLAALGSCTVMTLRVYADRKGWPLEGASVHLRSGGRSHEADCEKCETESVGIMRIERRIELTGPLTDEQRTRILQIADRCPVKQTIERGIRVDNVPATTI